MYGWRGKRIRFDLTKGKWEVEETPYEYRRKWLGGRGYNSEVLYNEVGPDVDPFSPNNLAMLGVGPLSGTFGPSTGRVTVTAKSPLTGGFGDSNMGGHWGAELKFAGYEQIILKGKAPKPSYIWIDDDKIEIRDASHIWGKFPRDADRIIKEELGDKDIHIVTIGPAGENLVRFACTFNDCYRAAGRTGHGAVIGSKNIKAIAVRGTGGVKIADPEKFYQITSDWRKTMRTDPMAQGLYAYGSLVLIMPCNYEMGWFPWKNLKYGYHPDARNISGEVWAKKHLKGKEGCFSCAIVCGIHSEIRDGKYAGEYTGGPEYEACVPTGPRVGIIDSNECLHGAVLTNNYGMDAIEAGASISWAMECWEKGYLTAKDTGGLELNWGDAEVVEKLLHMMAYREGFGDILAEGPTIAAKKLGVGEDCLVSTRGMSLPGDDPRGLGFGYGLSFAVGTRGGCDHLRSLCCLELSGYLYPGLNEKIVGTEACSKPLVTDGKAKMVWWEEHHKAFVDCLQVCCFNTHWSYGCRNEHLIPMLNAVTGLDFTEEECLTIGERIYNLERAYWSRQLSGKNDDVVPRRFTHEPMPENPAASSGKVLPIDEMLPDYYKLRQYEPETGFPGDKRLRELGLAYVAEELKPYREKYIAREKQKKAKKKDKE